MKTFATIFLGVLLLSNSAMAQKMITTRDTGKIMPPLAKHFLSPIKMW